MRWFESTTDVEAKERIPRFWKELKAGLDAGEFWADQIKSLRSDPEKRLSMALEHPPLPHAFKEASVALRALIREKRKSKESFEQYLAWLYWLAAVRSLMVPYAERLQEPGYNVLESIPGHVIQSLDFDYSTLGHDKLDLLNKTDRKWLVECWGEPETHSTLNALHRDVWDEYEGKLTAKRKNTNLSRLTPSPELEPQTTQGTKISSPSVQAIPGRKGANKARHWWIGALIVASAIAVFLFH